jgi:DNA-binding transcriptional ArsR family regulator
MVKNQEQQLDAIFHALSDKTRRAMLTRLAKGECNVSELAEPFEMSLAAVSKHLKVLEEAGLVEKEKDGRTFCCRPHFEPLNEANLLLEQFSVFWQDKLAELEKFLTTDSTTDNINKGENHHGPTRSKGNSKTSNSKSNSRKKRKGI